MTTPRNKLGNVVLVISVASIAVGMVILFISAVYGLASVALQYFGPTWAPIVIAVGLVLTGVVLITLADRLTDVYVSIEIETVHN